MSRTLKGGFLYGYPQQVAKEQLSTTLQKNFIILYLDAEAITVFKLSPFFAYERARGF